MVPQDVNTAETQIFVHMPNGDVQVFPVLPTTTVKELLPRLHGKKLYEQRPDRVERPLDDHECPVIIQRSYLSILGYGESDFIKEEARGHSYLFKFRAGDWSAERDTEVHDNLLGAGFLYHRRGAGLMKKWRLSHGELYPSKLIIYKEKGEEPPVLIMNLEKAEIKHYHKRLHGFTITGREIDGDGNAAQVAKTIHLAALSDLDKRGWFLRILNETRKDNSEVNLEQHMVEDLSQLQLSKTVSFLNLSCNAVKLNTENVRTIRHVPHLWLADNHLLQVPECLLSLPLEQLNISTNQIKELPPAFGRMITLKSLIVHTNLLTDVPKDFSKLKNLVVLVLSFNRLQEFPAVLCSLPQLQQLSLAGNFIKELPDSISVFEDLRKLIVQRNLITDVPDSITKLKKLQQLDLSFNYISKLPPMQFQHLDFLSLTNNPVEAAVLDIPSATFVQMAATRLVKFDLSRQSNNLVHLVLHKCSLKEFPDEVFDQLRHIETFVVNHNKLTKLPKRVFAVRTLRFLSAGWNHLESLPDLIENPNLHDIRVQANALTVLPAVLGKIINLRNLHASDNRLLALPKFDANHNSIEDLILGHNKLTDAAWDVVQDMPNLKLLDLSYNHLTELPEEIGTSCPSIELLNLTSNNIGTIQSLQNFKSATQVFLGSNRLKRIPPLPDNFVSLDVSFNNIKTVKFDHPKLKHIDLSGNRTLELAQGDFSVDTVEHIVLENMPHITRDYIHQRAVNVCRSDVLKRMATHVMNYSGCVCGTLDFGTAEMQGVRPTNEDAHIAMNNFMEDQRGLFCVFDGHAGDEVSNALRDTFADIFTEALKEMDCGDSEHPSCKDAQSGEDCIMRALRRSLRDANTQLGLNGKDKAGSTVVVTYLPRKVKEQRDIYVANVGDAECVLALKDDTVQLLSTKHSTNSRAEEERIRSHPGGFLNEASRVQGILATCRSLGDYRLYPYVSCLPDLKKVTVDESANFLILACDGLWDVLSYAEAASLIKSCQSPSLAAHLLRDYAYSLGSEDNITVVVIHLRPPESVEEVPILTRADSRKWAPSLSLEFIEEALVQMGRVNSVTLEEDIAELEAVAEEHTDQNVETRALIYGITTDTHMASSYLNVRRDSLAPDELRLENIFNDPEEAEKSEGGDGSGSSSAK